MKNFLLSLMICFIISGLISYNSDNPVNNDFYITAGRQTDFSNFELPSQKPLEMKTLENVNTEKNQDWYSEAMSNIKKSEYNLTFNEELNAYQSPNRENNMRFVYRKNGFKAMQRNNKIALFDENDKMTQEKDKKYKYLDDWNLSLELQSVSKELNPDPVIADRYTDFTKNDFVISENKISIENDNLRIQYSNDESGMRQYFIVKNKPDGKGSLRLNIIPDTKLKMILGADALMFKDIKGDLKLKYSSLKCWDANGKELRAYFEEQLQISNYKLQIEKDKSKIQNLKLLL